GSGRRSPPPSARASARGSSTRSGGRWGRGGTRWRTSANGGMPWTRFLDKKILRRLLATTSSRCSEKQELGMQEQDGFPCNHDVSYAPIPNHPGYLAGSDGSVWSKWPRGTRYRLGMPGRWRPLRPWVTHGRRNFRLRRADGTFRAVAAAVLILEAFAGSRPDG